MAPATSRALVGAVHGRIAVAVFASLMVAGCVSDLRTRRIPNVLVACIAICGVAYSIGDRKSVV
jgi:Flp pilus assembly protein protease CpaA